MNEKRLKKAERDFLKKYPGGFTHPEMVQIGKKHKMEKLKAMAKDLFAEGEFTSQKQVLDNLSKLVSASSMVSLFEKPKFRDFCKTAPQSDRKQIVDSVYELLHGSQKNGFEEYVDVLARHKLAKWTLTTVVPAYYRSKKDLFVKPMTTKHVIEYFDLDLKYHPRPTWDFYRKYRIHINKMKKLVDKSLSPSSAAFTGFLMMTMPK